jgi:hypothetical protein
MVRDMGWPQFEDRPPGWMPPLDNSSNAPPPPPRYPPLPLSSDDEEPAQGIQPSQPVPGPSQAAQTRRSGRDRRPPVLNPNDIYGISNPVDRHRMDHRRRLPQGGVPAIPPAGRQLVALAPAQPSPWDVPFNDITDDDEDIYRFSGSAVAQMMRRISLFHTSALMCVTGISEIF